MKVVESRVKLYSENVLKSAKILAYWPLGAKSCRRQIAPRLVLQIKGLANQKKT